MQTLRQFLTRQRSSVVQAYIDARRPVTAELYVVAPVAAPVPFQIQLTPGSASVKAAVEAELRDLILRESAPGRDTP
ncbi:baseplate J/gp47 family protein [Massilia eburnea]|uniref:baseplate J/gp47 family protein n=1 Tax=Massilia eburnea TaxID=1776165 RepID=UPI003D6A6DEC